MTVASGVQNTLSGLLLSSQEDKILDLGNLDKLEKLLSQDFIKLKEANKPKMVILFYLACITIVFKVSNYNGVVYQPKTPMRLHVLLLICKSALYL